MIVSVHELSGVNLDVVPVEDIPIEAWEYRDSYDLQVKDDMEKLISFLVDTYSCSEEVEVFENLLLNGYHCDYFRGLMFQADWI